MMIRTLAQLVLRQVRAPQERSHEGADPPPARHPTIKQPPCARSAGRCPRAAPKDIHAGEADKGLESPDQALVVLLTELAQRRVQAARAQEETHEYGSHHPDPP